VVRDPRRARQLWTAGQRAYYPFGPKDPRLAILRVTIERAEYWRAPGRMSYVLAAARAMLTGTPAGVLGENVKI
jgi:general stress protein 26